MGGLGSSPGWGLGRLGLERATLRTSLYGMASGGQEEPFFQLALAYDESSPRDRALHIYNALWKIQNGVPANI